MRIQEPSLGHQRPNRIKNAILRNRFLQNSTARRPGVQPKTQIFFRLPLVAAGTGVGLTNVTCLLSSFFSLTALVVEPRR